MRRIVPIWSILQYTVKIYLGCFLLPSKWFVGLYFVGPLQVNFPPSNGPNQKLAFSLVSQKGDQEKNLSDDFGCDHPKKVGAIKSLH